MRSDVSPNGENYAPISQTHVKKNIFDFFFDKHVNILANGVGSIQRNGISRFGLMEVPFQKEVFKKWKRLQ